MPLPDAVHHDSRGQRIFRIGDPIGENEAPLLLGCLLREPEISERAQHGRHDEVTGLLRIAAVEKMDLVGLAETTGEDFLRVVRGSDLCLITRLLPQERGGSFRFVGGETVQRKFLYRFVAGGIELLPITRVGDESPLTGPVTDLDAVVGRESVAQLALAVTPPDDTFNRFLLRELEFDPAFADLVAHPTARVAVTPVVEKTQLVPLGHPDVAARGALCPGRIESDVGTAGIEDFEFINAGLEMVCREDRETDPLRLDRSKAIRILAGIDHGALDTGFYEGHKGGEGLVDFGLACREPLHLGACRLGLGRPQIAVGILDPGDKGLHRVIILRADGVKLVIVAAGAPDAEPEESLSDIHHDLVERILTGEPLRRLIFTDLTGQQDRGGHEKPRRRILAEGIARDLLTDELVVRRVGVEGLDDIVAIGPGIGTLGINLKPVGVGIPHHIEPVLCPAFTVAR